MKELVIKALVDKLPDVLAFVDEQLEAADCPMKTQMQIDVSVEEIFVNIANNACPDDTGNAKIPIGKTVGIYFWDYNGKHYYDISLQLANVNLGRGNMDKKSGREISRLLFLLY